MQPPAETLPSLRQILHVLYRHKGKMLLAFVASVAAAVGVTALMQPAYRSEAKLFVRLGRENSVLDPTATMGQGPILAVPQSREDEINSVVELLQSDVLLTQVIEEFGTDAILGAPEAISADQIAGSQISATQVSNPVQAGLVNAKNQTVTPSWSSRLNDFWKRIGPGPDSAPEDVAMAKLRRRLMVFAPKKSNVITIRYDGPSPKLAQAIVNKLADLYLAQHISLNRTPHSRDFFAKQTEELHQRLNKAEQKLRDLKDETGIASIYDQRKILVDRLGKLEDDQLDSDSQLAVAAAELGSLEDRLKVLPETLELQRTDGLANQAFDGMRQRLYDLQLKEQQLLSIFKDEAFQVREIRREIVEAKKILGEEMNRSSTVTIAKNKAYEETEMEVLENKTKVASLKARTEKLNEQILATRHELEQLNHHQIRLAQLERDVELQDAQFKAYSRNLEQARIDQALETNRISNISIVQPATLDGDAVRPNKLSNLGLGILMGGFAGLCLALAAEYFDHSLRTVEDVETRLGLPALGSLPKTKHQILRANGAKGSHDQPLAR